MITWYRIIDWGTASPVDEFGNPCGDSGVEVHCMEYDVERETPCGVWLSHDGERRWCSKNARRKFACPTIEGALFSFYARKRKQASIYRVRADKADSARRLASLRYGNHPLKDVV